MRLDDAVLTAVNRKTDDAPKPDTEVPVNDTRGLRAMFQRMGSRQR